ncbi:MAG: DUF4365 domain-containing protein [Gammaproteobacteria bacterium]|nr:DUF4365 domain-containing protein [Gammaproteobacteria bacterium]
MTLIAYSCIIGIRMNSKQSKAEIIERRGELIAELFLQDLNPSFVAKPTTDFGYDFFIGFPNANGGINNYAVEVKATERPVSSRFSVKTTLYERLAHSNIPALLIVVDVKQNRLFYAWLTHEGTKKRCTHTTRIPVTEVDDAVKEKLRKQLVS